MTEFDPLAEVTKLKHRKQIMRKPRSSKLVRCASELLALQARGASVAICSVGCKNIIFV